MFLVTFCFLFFFPLTTLYTSPPLFVSLWLLPHFWQIFLLKRKLQNGNSMLSFYSLHFIRPYVWLCDFGRYLPKFLNFIDSFRIRVFVKFWRRILEFLHHISFFQNSRLIWPSLTKIRRIQTNSWQAIFQSFS